MPVSAEEELRDLAPGVHLCFIHESRRECRDVLVLFLRHGLEDGQRVICAGGNQGQEDMRPPAGESEFSLDPYLENGQLAFSRPGDLCASIEEGTPEGLRNMVSAEVERAVDDGHAGLRMVLDMTAALDAGVSPERLLRCDARLNHLPSDHPCLVLCRYDRQRFSAGMLLDVLRTHSVAVIGTELYDNFFYVPPDKLLGGQPQEAEFEQWRGNLAAKKREHRELQQANHRLEEALEELRRTRRQVIEQERQRALSEMASGIAHDFNNSLSTIRGFTDLLLRIPEKLEDTQQARQYLGLIDKAAAGASQTVRRMRKFYRPREEESFEPLNLNNLIEEAVSMTRPRWKIEAQTRGAEIEVIQEPAYIGPVLGNEAELQEMLTNLIFNAVDALEDGGTIRLHTCQQNDTVLLEISDTGAGMSEDVRRHCLDPFFSTKGRAGSGLGLSTVRGIVNRHNAEIEVESAPGTGTTFRIRFPLAEESRRSKADHTPEGKELRDLKLLVIEDEQEQCRLLREYLTVDNHTVHIAHGGREGLRKFMNGWYDLVITDRAMPELSGDLLAEEIKRAAPDKPVIMLTGSADMMEAAGEKPDAVDLLLAKPVTLRILRRAIARVM